MGKITCRMSWLTLVAGLVCSAPAHANAKFDCNRCADPTPLVAPG